MTLKYKDNDPICWDNIYGDIEISTKINSGATKTLTEDLTIGGDSISLTTTDTSQIGEHEIIISRMDLGTLIPVSFTLTLTIRLTTCANHPDLTANAAITVVSPSTETYYLS